ncbi:MAG: UDP-N-acetylglucosamine--N-acetylmuramyl-(pentapeptide) pyrophosphoryl-undecaprenol N-acetylglucosamine transferase [candidate division WS2 bacterium]|nr:UDP-N-acetylglucosamine--N-acetylmuramyl-(pentapeptide) pyrophosphoryl-undecaprenol N-acetylglucosamine transferase [Candidatus Lithacetigena glycinireducens]
MVVITGGGTGGHFYPAISLAESIRKDGIKVHYIGSTQGVEQTLIKEFMIPYDLLDIKPYSMKNLVKNALETIKAYKVVSRVKPSVIVGFGGYVMVPVIISSLLKKVPFILHEQNVVPGRANKMFSKWASKITTGFKETDKPFSNSRAIYTGTPIREEFYSVSKEEVLKDYGFIGGKPVILVLGGSKGSRFLNKIAGEVLPILLSNNDFYAIHLTGKDDYEEIVSICNNHKLSTRWKVHPFLHEIWNAIACSNVVLTRGGGSVLAELARFRVKAIVVPYPYAINDHQYYNGKSYIRDYGGFLLRETECEVVELEKKILNLLEFNSNGSKLPEKDEATETLKGILKQYL